MPQAALLEIRPDYMAKAAEIGQIVDRLARGSSAADENSEEELAK